MREVLFACSLLIAAGGESAPKVADAPAFDFKRYVPTNLSEAEKPADGICSNSFRVSYITDMALTPIRLHVRASQSFRPLSADAARILAQYNASAQPSISPRYDEEVLVRIEGRERWLPIQAQVAPFWRKELADGQDAWLYASRVGCILALAPADDRAILSINEYQIEPIGQPEPTP